MMSVIGQTQQMELLDTSKPMQIQINHFGFQEYLMDLFRLMHLHLQLPSLPSLMTGMILG